MRFTDSPLCRVCMEEIEMVSHVLLKSRAVSTQRVQHLDEAYLNQSRIPKTLNNLRKPLEFWLDLGWLE